MKNFERALYFLLQEHPFIGALIQNIDIKYQPSKIIPTAGIYFNKSTNKIEMLVNPNFFESLPLEHQKGILHHEVLHFVFRHLDRLILDNRQLDMIAADLVVNQYERNLPKGTVDINNFFTDDGKPFPRFRSKEEYYELLKKLPPEKIPQITKIDEHLWDKLTEEEQKHFLDEAEKITKRALEKTGLDYNKLPAHLKDLLERIKTSKSALNHKQILRNAIKRTVSVCDRTPSWLKRNKRYGAYAPGQKLDSLPQLNIYIDFSGSMSAKEANVCLQILDDFLRTGIRQCTLKLWHTSIFYNKKYKRGRLKESDIESGGTDVSCVLSDINKTKPDLSIIMTDMYFEMPTNFPSSEVVWIVTEGGNKNNNFPGKQKIIYLENLK